MADFVAVVSALKDAVVTDAFPLANNARAGGIERGDALHTKVVRTVLKAVVGELGARVLAVGSKNTTYALIDLLKEASSDSFVDLKVPFLGSTVRANVFVLKQGGLAGMVAGTALVMVGTEHLSSSRFPFLASYQLRSLWAAHSLAGHAVTEDAWREGHKRFFCEGTGDALDDERSLAKWAAESSSDHERNRVVQLYGQGLEPPRVYSSIIGSRGVRTHYVDKSGASVKKNTPGAIQRTEGGAAAKGKVTVWSARPADDDKAEFVKLDQLQPDATENQARARAIIQLKTQQVVLEQNRGKREGGQTGGASGHRGVASGFNERWLSIYNGKPAIFGAPFPGRSQVCFAYFTAGNKAQAIMLRDRIMQYAELKDPAQRAAFVMLTDDITDEALRKGAGQAKHKVDERRAGIP